MYAFLSLAACNLQWLYPIETLPTDIRVPAVGVIMSWLYWHHCFDLGNAGSLSQLRYQ